MISKKMKESERMGKKGGEETYKKGKTYTGMDSFASNRKKDRKIGGT